MFHLIISDFFETIGGSFVACSGCLLRELSLEIVDFVRLAFHRIFDIVRIAAHQTD